MAQAHFWDPAGERYGIPTFPWRLAPQGLATRRQLVAQGLRPGGQEVAAQILCRRGTRVAYLYQVAQAKPKRPMTSAKARALAAANAARRWCPIGGHDAGYVIPTRWGACAEHADPLDV